MLALKASVEVGAGVGGRKKGPGVPRTLVFDEIDTGIGGRAAEAVGKKLKELARTNQVLCVTHLPQIATFADHHYLIEKKESAGRTRTFIRHIIGDERTEEEKAGKQVPGVVSPAPNPEGGSWQGSTRTTPPARAAQNPAAPR